MSKQEEKILEIIKNKPTIEQSEIAKLLGIKRSTVAVHISNLQKQGYIEGKGYILAKEEYVLGIGATNIDIYGKSKIRIQTHYDHPATIVSDVGGVTRNILTNLSKLNVNTKIITALGNDMNAQTVINDFKKNNIDSKNVIVVEDDATGVFMQVQDENNDMYLAVCDMSCLDSITPEYINKNKNILLNAKIIVIDTSIKDETIKEIINICKDKVPIYADPISDNYAKKLKPYIPYLTAIKPNRTELESISDIKINNEKDLEKACNKLINKGLKKIFVSNGKDGILYIDNQNVKIKRKLKPINKMVNASGAGDAAMAAILYGEANNLTIEKTIDYALAAGMAAIKSKTTINNDMSIDLLNKILKENKNEL